MQIFDEYSRKYVLYFANVVLKCFTFHANKKRREALPRDEIIAQNVD